MIYSTKEDKFYAPEFKESYEASGTWPDDGIEVSPEDFKEFSAGKDGHFRKFENGALCWAESQPNLEELSRAERVWRDGELRRADEELNKVQDADPKAVGSVADWRTYRKALRQWPESLEFPSLESRPKSP